MFCNIEKSGQRIRQLRILNRQTQEEIACLLDIDRSFYSRIESGQKGCSVDVFVRFATFYHMSLDYLILPPVEKKDAHSPDLKSKPVFARYCFPLVFLFYPGEYK